jgi:hypothetical protein
LLKQHQCCSRPAQSEDAEDVPPTKQRRGRQTEPQNSQLEEQFEQLLDATRVEEKPVRELLPIKTVDGSIQRRSVPLPPEPEVQLFGNICCWQKTYA